MAGKRISELSARTEFDSACNLPVETLPANDPDLTQRVTGEHVSAFTNLKPFTGVVRNVGLLATVDAGALTIALKQSDGESDPSADSVHSVVEAIFRPEVADSGARERLVFDEALSITIPSGATLGYANGEDAKIFVYLYRSGASRGLAVSKGQKSPEVPVTLIAISSGADDGDAAYSDAFDGEAGLVCIGYVEVLAITTAGTWTAPDIVYAGEILLSTGGVSTFVDLTDAPDSFASQAGKLVAVNEDEDGLEFVSPSSSNIEEVTTVNAATYDVLSTDHVLLVTYSATGTCAIELKTAQLVAGRKIKIKDAGGLAKTNPITISTEGAETIDGAATAVINANFGAIELICDGANWFTLAVKPSKRPTVTRSNLASDFTPTPVNTINDTGVQLDITTVADEVVLLQGYAGITIASGYVGTQFLIDIDGTIVWRNYALPTGTASVAPRFGYPLNWVTAPLAAGAHTIKLQVLYATGSGQPVVKASATLGGPTYLAAIQFE